MNKNITDLKKTVTLNNDKVQDMAIKEYISEHEDTLEDDAIHTMLNDKYYLELYGIEGKAIDKMIEDGKYGIECKAIDKVINDEDYKIEEEAIKTMIEDKDYDIEGKAIKAMIKDKNRKKAKEEDDSESDSSSGSSES